jgi:hypothetical protein
MGLFDIINGLDTKFVNEAQETYTVAYKKDGKELSRNVLANSDSEARNKFQDMMDANNEDSGNYRIVGVSKAVGMDETIDEENTTANLDGGLGQPKTPHAFQNSKPTSKDKDKERKNATSSTGYGIAKKTSNYVKRRDEMFLRAEELITKIDEARYSDYAGDDSRSPKKKINQSISEINRRLYEIEHMLNHAMRLKRETGLEDVFWKSTKSRFSKISERMLRIGNKLREFNK